MKQFHIPIVVNNVEHFKTVYQNDCGELVKFLVNGKEVGYESFCIRLEISLTNHCVDQYDDMLDETTYPFKCGNITIMPSRILKVLDPVSYRCMLGDYVDVIYDDAMYDFDNGEHILTVDGDVYESVLIEQGRPL